MGRRRRHKAHQRGAGTAAMVRAHTFMSGSQQMVPRW